MIAQQQGSEEKNSSPAQRLERFKALKLELNMSRGQPSPEQLDLSNGLLSVLGEEDYYARDGLDCRNYPGGVPGLPEAREWFAKLLEVPEAQVLVGNNASIEIMQHILSWAMLRGLPGGSGPWKDQKVRFLCPAPGYDRHFYMLEVLGVEMINVPMTEEGPDMDVVERLAADDASVKGIWCVPKYSNPTGVTFSDAVVDRLASMKTAAGDFRIFWDNAYAVHHLVSQPAVLKNIYDACLAAQNPNRVYVFASTSKITFAGSGIAAMGTSAENFKHMVELIGSQTIGPDKLNQLRHVRFLEQYPGGLPALMEQHAELLRPKFEAVEQVFQRELAGTGLARWSTPEGGYFINLDTQPGLAQKVVALAKEHGVTLTPAGATFPYGKDPADSNIRIAPSRPSLKEVTIAAEIIALCVLHLSSQPS